MKYASAVLLAAGKGKRLKSRLSKALIKINGKPLISYSLTAFQKHPSIKEIVVVANRANIASVRRLIKECGISKVTAVVLGGLRRQDSVYNGLKAAGKDADTVLIHDSARPFVSGGTISILIKKACSSKAAIAGVPVKPTIKEAGQIGSRSKVWRVKKTLAREKLWEIQTPQAFRKSLLLKAYQRFGRREATDDAALVEKLGVKPEIVLGSYQNIKVTTPEDILLAEAIAAKMRVR